MLKMLYPVHTGPGQGVVGALEYILLRGGFGGSGFGMIQAQYIYCALDFCNYYISSSSDHQALGLELGTPALDNGRSYISLLSAVEPEDQPADSGWEHFESPL